MPSNVRSVDAIVAALGSSICNPRNGRSTPLGRPVVPDE